MTDIAKATPMLDGVTITGRSKLIHNAPAKKTFQAELSGAGAAATVVFEGSNLGGVPVVLGTVTLTSAAPSDGFYHEGPWAIVSANVTAISGAGASVSAAMGG